jgi:hypothetical protein
MEETKAERHQDVEAVAATTEMSKERIEASRLAYNEMMVHLDDRATEVSIDQLVDLGIAEMAVEILGYESFDTFFKAVDPKAKQKVGFRELMVAIQNCAEA